jgi:hypothetical protein
MRREAKVYSSVRLQASTLARLRAFGQSIGPGIAGVGMGAAAMAQALLTMDDVITELLDRVDEHRGRAARQRAARQEKRRAQLHAEKGGG